MRSFDDTYVSKSYCKMVNVCTDQDNQDEHNILAVPKSLKWEKVNAINPAEICVFSCQAPYQNSGSLRKELYSSFVSYTHLLTHYNECVSVSSLWVSISYLIRLSTVG